MKENLYKPLLVGLLNVLTTVEINRFSRFISNDYFNTDQYIVRLFEALKKKIDGELSLEVAFLPELYKTTFKTRKTKGGLTKKEKKELSTKISVLTQLLKDFLVIEELKDNNATKSKVLYQALLDRNQLQLIYKQYYRDKKEWKNSTFDINFHQYAFEVENGYLYYLEKKELWLKENNIREIHFHLDMFYLLKKLELYSNSISIQKLSSQFSFDYENMNPALALTQISPYKEQNLIIVYRTVIHLMQTNDEKYYTQLLVELEQFEQDIPSPFLMDFYTSAGNFCIQKIIKGNVEYNRNLFDLYQKMDAKDLLTTDNQLSAMRLKNVVALSCRMGDFEWATELAHKYRNQVLHQDKISVFHFNMSVIAFYQADYKKTIYHSIRVNKINTNIDVNCRILMIKAHFELDEEYDERTMTIFRTAEQFVHKNKALSPNHKKSYRNFIRFLINLYRIKYRIGKRTKQNFIQNLNKTAFISDKKWLQVKIHNIHYVE